jgi:very-short-patch-repair endonuclease
MTSKGIEHHLRRGDLHRIHRCVYSLIPPPLLPGARELAAVLACGPGALLSHRSAAVHLGLLPDDGGPIHVTVATHRVGPPGVTVHRATAEGTVHREVPITTTARTLLDLAATAPAELDRALNEARVLRLVAGSSLDAQLERPHRGRGRLRAALGEGPTFTRSQAERELLALLRRARLPRPETNVRLAGHEVDAHFPAARLVVEVDGYAFHSSRAAFERDRRRDAELQARGYRVLRLSWRQLTAEPEASAALLAQALALTLR